MPQELKNHAWKWLSLFPGADIMTEKKSHPPRLSRGGWLDNKLEKLLSFVRFEQFKELIKLW